MGFLFVGYCFPDEYVFHVESLMLDNVFHIQVNLTSNFDSTNNTNNLGDI